MSSERAGITSRNGRELGWRRLGEGPPLLLLNGYAATTADWDPVFLDALGGSFELILPDHRGMGTSTWGDDAEPLTVETMAQDAGAVLDDLGLDRVPVAGWSMGGMVAQALAIAAPERISAMALLSTDTGGPSAVLADPAVWARLVDSSGTPREQATRLLSLLFPEPLASQIDAQVGQLVADARAGLDDHVLRAQEAALTAFHRDPLPTVTDPPPTLVAHGQLDVVIPVANADLLSQRWSASPPSTFEGCGHAFMAQVPTDLAALLAEHLGR